ncbi:MAG: hypothetical protein WBF67_01350 [Olleya sp.]
MTKNITAIFFLMVFAFLISAPTVIMAIDDTTDISYFYSITEEEENNNTSKKISELNVHASDNMIDLESLYFSNRGNSLQYRFKTYNKPHLNLISPPPEFIL